MPNLAWSTGSDIHIERNSPEAEAVLLRTIIKNNQLINQKLKAMLKDKCNELGVHFSEQMWRHVVIAHSSELEQSLAHVIF